jgi:hypothetical protein
VILFSLYISATSNTPEFLFPDFSIQLQASYYNLAVPSPWTASLT